MGARESGGREWIESGLRVDRETRERRGGGVLERNVSGVEEGGGDEGTEGSCTMHSLVLYRDSH